MSNSCKIIAHRGASGLAPENTLAAINKALAIGVDMIEIDVRQSLDGTIVLMHDTTVNRTTNGKGRVARLTIDELKQLDAGTWFDKSFGSERVPTLEEVLNTVNSSCGLLIEVKDGNLQHPLFCKRLVRLIQAHKAHSWVIVQSFSSKLLQMMHRLDCSIELNKLVNYAIPGFPLYHDGMLRLGNVFNEPMTTGVNPNARYFSRAMVRKLDASKRVAYPWTVNDPKAMERLIARGARGIITNHPERLKALLEKAPTS